MTQAFIRFPQADGSFLFFRYDGDVLNCQQASELLDGLHDKLAACETTPPPGEYMVRDCGVVIDPPASQQQVYGYPRTLEGTHNGNPIFSGTGLNFLLEVYNNNPDDFAPKGVNLTGIVWLSGRSAPAGINTDFYGQAPPDGFTRPSGGYRMRLFGGNLDQKHWEQSNLPDEVPTTPTTPDPPVTPPVDPGTPQDYDSQGDLVGYVQTN